MLYLPARRLRFLQNKQQWLRLRYYANRIDTARNIYLWCLLEKKIISYKSPGKIKMHPPLCFNPVPSRDFH